MLAVQAAAMITARLSVPQDMCGICRIWFTCIGEVTIIGNTGSLLVATSKTQNP